MAQNVIPDCIDHTVEQRGNIAIVTLDRPAASNALTISLVHSLARTIDALERDSGVRAIVLTGAGNAFCAGQALDDAGVIGPNSRIDLTAAIRDGYNPLINAMMTSETPIVAAVNGPAAGAGFSLACACDFRIVSENAFFTSAFVKIGLAPDGGLSFTLPRIIGYAKALELCMLSERIDAQRADALGLCTRVVPATEVLTESIALAERLTRAARSLGLTKRLLRQNALPGLQQALEVELEIQANAVATSDFREGIAAFVGKREPHFSGS